MAATASSEGLDYRYGNGGEHGLRGGVWFVGSGVKEGEEGRV